ncbi:MAG: peptide deformylase [Buchnera aphidicola (Eriosoma harunire)]
MSLLNLIHYPNPILRMQSKPVKIFNKNIKNIINNMLETMYFYDGIGLAAPQIGIHLNIIVINVDQKQEHILINPYITYYNGNSYLEEGCLSIPNYKAKIHRSSFIKVIAMNQTGNHIEILASSLLAVCIQHEMDHLKGTLFIDYLSTLKRNRIHKKIKKQLNLK